MFHSINKCNTPVGDHASASIPLTRGGTWGLEKLVKSMRMQVEIINQKHRIVPGGSSHEY